MSIWTFYFDIAGTIDRNTTSSDAVTVSCVAIPSDDEAKVRNQIGNSTPKWSNTSSKVAETMVKTVLNWAVYANAVRIKKSEPRWNDFWISGETHQELLLHLAESVYGNNRHNRELRFMRPANILKFYLFGIGFADLIASCIKEGKLSPVVDSNGQQTLKLKLFFDSDISGDQNQDAFKYLWEVWSKITDVRNKLNISPQIDLTEFKTEREDPNLLLPDYIGGLFHSFHSSHVLPPNGIQESFLKNWAKQLESSGKFSFNAHDFDVVFPEFVQQK